MWLVRFVVFFCWLGLIAGLILDPLSRLAGFHLADREPVWFIMVCAIVCGSAWIADAIRKRGKHRDAE
jgi:hypothetical protein